MIKNRKAGKIALSVLLAATVTVGTGSLLVAHADTSAIADFTLPAMSGPYNINAGVGSDVTKMNFNWFTQSKAATQVRYALASTLNSDGSLPSSATAQGASQSAVVATEQISLSSAALPGVDGANDGQGDGKTNGKTPAGVKTGEYANSATVTGLQPGTKYAYQVSDGTNWSNVYTITTGSTDSVHFAAFGDPQIGAFDNGSGTAKSAQTGGHKSVADDETGWGNMMGLVSQIKGLNFLFSMGDQVNDYSYLINPKNKDSSGNLNDGQWNQYNYFFSPNKSSVVQSYQLAAFEGNHDHQMGEYYGYHYNQPNKSSLGATQYGNDGDYWFTSGPVLFVVLNANNYGTADHDQFISSALRANPNAKWKVAVWHQSAYSEANHNTNNSTDDPVVTIRNTWPAMMDKYGIDVVLQGHDHYYTRTAQMIGGNTVDPNTGAVVALSANTGSTIPATTNTNATYATKAYPSSVTNPKGTVYFTLDSGSGSKYYNYNNGTTATLNTPADHTFSVVGWQGYLPTYSDVKFTNDAFTISTYSTTDYTMANQKLIDTYTISKTSANNNSSSSSSSTGSTSSNSAATGTSSTGTASTTSTSSVSNPHTGAVAQDNALANVIGFAAIAALLGGASFVVLRKKKV
ncbi:MAG: metallophosphoesterase family protein [Ethanoligenens sp.]